MSSFCPAYPQPRVKRASIWAIFRSARHSWIGVLYERSYHMQMGEAHLPGADIYMVNDPALVRRVLVEESERFPKSKLLSDALRPLLGESIFTTNGARWRRQREMMNPAFGQTKLDIVFPAMLAASQDMVKRLQQAAHNGFEQDIEIEMTHVTADIIFRTIFSEPLGGDDAHQIFDAFARFQALAPKIMLPSLYGVRWLVWPWSVWRSRKAASEIRHLLERLIQPRHQAYLAGTDVGKDDILKALMVARDDRTGEPFSFEELVDQVAMLILAGHETSASALTWAAYLLANDTDVQERVYAETMNVMGLNKPKQRDMKDLILTRNVFRETLRLFPPVGFMARQAIQNCPMRDKVVPEGASVMIAPWLIHRHRDRWDNPDAFDPDRFDRPESRESIRNAYLPFSMGPRVCIGATFALQEATLILSTLIRHFRLEAVDGHVPQPVGRLTIRSANGVRLRTLDRKQP